MMNKTIQILNRKRDSVFKPLCISPVTREKGGFAIKSFRLIIAGVLLLFSTVLTADDLYLFDDRFQPALGLSNDIYNSPLSNDNDENKPTAAVIEFAVTGINETEAITLFKRFSSVLVRTEALVIVERNMMNEILEEQGFQQSGCTTSECAVEIGTLLGVQKMITGSFGKIGNSYTIETRIFSVESGKTEKTISKTVRGEVDGLLTLIEIAAWELVGLEPPSELFSFIVLSESVSNSENSDSLSSSVYLSRNYPAKPMLYSLVLPGLGQYNNGDPLWKSAIFAGVEVASIVSWIQWNKQAEDIRKEYELFGDTHWSLKSWVENTLNPLGDLIQYDDFKLDGTHNLDLHLTGSLAETFGEFISSDSLVSYPHWIYSDEISILQDQHFYENIGKYDQFVGGWDDFSDWYAEEKTVEDTIEIILMTPNKNDYNKDRARSNDLLTMANYAVTAIMFNHVISGIEAVLTNQRNARSKAGQSKTDVGLYYDPRNKYGIGGITVSYKW